MPPLRVIDVVGAGTEDVVVDAEGAVVTGVEDGRVLRVSPDGRHLEVIADTGGRPLGIELLPDGTLLVCDAKRGLLAVDPAAPYDERVRVLATEVGGELLVFCNNAAVAADGTVYFTDSSRHFGIEHWRGDLLEHAGTGRLLRRDPDGSTHVLVDGLQFANGVALAPDESWVAVAETGAYRVSRLWLTGPQAGTRDLLVDNLPAFPDNISTGSDGLVWLGLASPRDPALDLLASRHPALRKAVWALPQRLQPGPKKTVWVRAVDAHGTVIHDYQAPGVARFHMVTGVREHHGTVWLGSLVSSAIACFEVPAFTA